MKKDKKSELIADMVARFKKSDAVFAIKQNKMTVVETEDLRRKLRGAAANFLVSKNTLSRLAVKDTSFECILPALTGQTALVFSDDITGTAKVIDEFSSKSGGKIAVECGGYQGKFLSVADVKMLAKLPSIDELRAKIIAVIQTPAQRMAVLLQAPAVQIARVLNGYSEKQ